MEKQQIKECPIILSVVCAILRENTLYDLLYDKKESEDLMTM